MSSDILKNNVHSKATTNKAQNLADFIRRNTTRIRITQHVEEHKIYEKKSGKRHWSYIIKGICHKFDWCVRQVLQFPCAIELQHKTFVDKQNKFHIMQNCLLFDGQFRYDIRVSNQLTKTSVFQVC